MESEINRPSRSGFALTSLAVDQCDMYNKTYVAIWHNSRDRQNDNAFSQKKGGLMKCQFGLSNSNSRRPLSNP